MVVDVYAKTNVEVTRSSATAEKQRVSCACLIVYLGWLTDRAVHRTPQNRRSRLQLDYSLVVSTVSAKKASEVAYAADEVF